VKDLKGQVKNGSQRAHIDNWYSKELETKLLKLFEEGYNRGSLDVKKEVKKTQQTKQLKLKPGINFELKLCDDKAKKQAKILSITIQKLLNTLKSTVDYDLASMSDKQLITKGGIDGYFDALETTFDGAKRNILNDVTSGYTVGRNDTIDEIATDETELLYSGILDKNFCDKCSEWDGLTFSVKEIKDSTFLSLSGDSINLNCLGLLGKNKCRCAWIVYG
jgi:hypothetical protein